MTNCVRCRCGDDLSLVSADQFGSYIEIPGGNVRVPLGYVGVLAPLLRDLPSCALKLVETNIVVNVIFAGEVYFLSCENYSVVKISREILSWIIYF